MSRFHFGFIVILLVLGVMLPEYTTIKMKLFSVSQWKIDDVFPIFSTVQWILFEVDLSLKKKKPKKIKKNASCFQIGGCELQTN